MSKAEGPLNKPALHPAGKYSRLFFLVAVFAVVVILVVRNIGVFGNVLKVIIGFGAVVLTHEFGHFIVAKLSGIKVEAFSIFMPPTLFGVRKTKDGLRFRFLPTLFAKEDAESGGEQSSSADKKEDDRTEYRIGLIPFGGFVKMLGQEDVGSAKTSDDPRSFANKPAGVRMGVLTAGVVFNAISAIIIFMIVFLVGIKLPPPVVGGVIPDSPAARAGIKPSDEIIAIADESKDIDFSYIRVEAALSDENEAVPIKVKHENGSIEDFALVAEGKFRDPMIAFGILQPSSLTITEVSDPNKLYSKTGLLPGDKVVAINGKEVQNSWELEKIVENSLASEVTLLAERTSKAGKPLLVNSKTGLELVPPMFSPSTRKNGSHIYSMVPRLRMENIEVQKSPWMKITAKGRQLLEKTGIIEKTKEKPFVQSGDVILSVGDVICPTSQEFREAIKGYPDKELPIKVLRTDADGIEKVQTINVRPKGHKDANDAAIGISFAPMFDTKHSVVAKTIDTEGGPEKLEIPRGATITAVDGAAVSNFYDVIGEIQKHPGERITIDWRLDAETAGSATLNVDNNNKDSITVKSDFAEYIPFGRFERLYKASGPIDAVTMGLRKTIMFIAQTYATLKGLIVGLISPKTALMGPVGIIALSYRVVAHEPLIYYLYLLGLISAVIAVFNFLPLPPFDGGLVVLLLIEKIKGSALSERTQGIIAYTGWVLIGAFVLYVTFNDIMRIFSG
jgi:regulator of sigma E protease